MPESEAPILLANYDPGWVGLFDVERQARQAVLAPWLAGPIEHIGSTAVPGKGGAPDYRAPGGPPRARSWSARMRATLSSTSMRPRLAIIWPIVVFGSLDQKRPMSSVS
jgi:hypothetical protein